MRDIYLGDSYDLVKRFWADTLAPVGRLFAHHKFIPNEIRADYTRVTGVPVLVSEERITTPFGILMDPNTGIPLPTETRTSASSSHAPLPFIVQEIGRLNPAYVICFDQSRHRKRDLDQVGQRDSKRAFLTEYGIQSFYYVSHAPFLFLASDAQVLKAIRLRLESCGIPRWRFESEVSR